MEGRGHKLVISKPINLSKKNLTNLNYLSFGGVVDCCQGDESTDVLSFFLQDTVIPNDGNGCKHEKHLDDQRAPTDIWRFQRV